MIYYIYDILYLPPLALTSPLPDASWMQKGLVSQIFCNWLCGFPFVTSVTSIILQWMVRVCLRSGACTSANWAALLFLD